MADIWCEYFDSSKCCHPEVKPSIDCIGIADCDIQKPMIICTDKDE